jgi:hypothetical protein
MTTAGDIGSGTGTEPMTKFGEKPLRRKKPLKKQENKMKSFRDMIKLQESPVGKVGRTKDSEAAEHIENSNLAKQFRKIVKELGGKNVARQLLAGMKQSGNRVKSDGTESTNEAKTMNPTTFLIELGYKIKDEKYEKYSFELEFYNAKDTKDAYKELQDEGFLDYYNMTSAGKIIGFEYK